jgi:hypothetical protein
LRENRVPLLYAFSDGPKTPSQRDRVEEVRGLLRGIDWTEVRVVERQENLGLGRSIRAGVDEVLAEHDAVIVFEDDLVCVPGTYVYLCEAMARYRSEPAVMSVTGFTHPRITPSGVDMPYFDGRAESLTWGTWRRAWCGMDRRALELLDDVVSQRLDPRRYGADLPEHAALETSRNLWAVRWLYLHIAQRGLCLRPPRSLVNHIGIDERATNSAGDESWHVPVLGPPPAGPVRWPRPVEHPHCAALWRRTFPERTWPRRLASAALAALLGRRRMARG